MEALLRSLLIAGLAVWSHGAQAVVNENLGVSNQALSLGNAVTADPPGVMAIHFNPAGLTRIEDTTLEVNVVSPNFKWEAEFSAPAHYDGVFGYTDDPVIGQSSSSSDMSMYAPGLGWVKPPRPFALPLASVAYKPKGSRFTFANGIYAPSVLGLHRDDPDDPARYGARRLALERITYFAPSFGYRYSDSLSFGASVGFNYTAFAIKTDFRAPNPLIAFVGFMQENVCPAISGIQDMVFLPDCLGEGMGPFADLAQLEMTLTDPLSLSYNLGMLWEPSDWFGLGAVYHSEMTANLDGDFTFRNSEAVQSTFNALGASPLFGPIAYALGLPIYADGEDSGRARMDLVFPAHLQVGMKLRPIERVQFNVDWSWSDWEKWSDLTFGYDRPSPVLQFAGFLGFGTATQLMLPRHYRGVGHWSFGMRLDVTDRLQLRLGYEPRKSSIPADKIDTIAPLGDAELYALGLGYTYSDTLSFDLAAGYMKSEVYTLDGASCNMNCEGIDNLVYNPYAGLDVTTSLEVLILGTTITYKF